MSVCDTLYRYLEDRILYLERKQAELISKVKVVCISTQNPLQNDTHWLNIQQQFS
jgi:hypothetical protein